MKNILKIIVASAFVLLSACGGLEDTVSVSETTYKNIEPNGYRVLVDVDCVGGGFLSSDKCEGSKTCVTVTFNNDANEALESVESCKDLGDVGITTFTLISEKALDDAVTITVGLDVQNEKLSVFDFDKETTTNIQKQ